MEDNFLFEENHWWFLGRRRIIGNLIGKFFKGTKQSLALDAGCGTGIFLKDLKRYAVSIGIDRSKVALEYTGRRGCGRIICADIGNLPFKDGSFGLITVLGVLYNESVKDDNRAIEEAYRVLEKDGIMIIDEAAYKFLQSRHNISVKGVRRYTRSQLIGKCKKCGFEILKSSYWNTIMLPLFLLIVGLDKISAAKQRYAKLTKIPTRINTFLAHYLYLEAFLMRYIDFPFGPSIVIVAKK